MHKKKIFITGAGGCIGHYIIEQLLADPQNELHLLIRTPEKLRFATQNQSQVVVYLDSLENIEQFKPILSQMNAVIHIATSWANTEDAFFINYEKTKQLFDSIDPTICDRILYFSTASILGPNNLLLKEAEQFGTGYIRSKYKMFTSLDSCRYSDRIITLFPTVVFGGDAHHPPSHISSGIISAKKWLNLLRFFYLDSAFHFMHAQDIASVATALLTHPSPQKSYVLGHAAISGKDTIALLCKTFRYRQYFRFKIPLTLLLRLAKLLKIPINPWGLFCLKNPFFVYQTVSPSDFNKPTVFPSLESILTRSLKIKTRP